jgi:hypothetical protein
LAQIQTPFETHLHSPSLAIMDVAEVVAEEVGGNDPDENLAQHHFAALLELWEG